MLDIVVSLNTLENIRAIAIPKNVLEDTFKFLRTYGKQYKEAHAIWVGSGGYGETDSFAVSDVWFPQQHNTAVTYTVPDHEIHRINVKLNHGGLIAIAQVHTHPNEAFHSGIDDDGSSLISLTGSFSIVIPDYGFVKEDGVDLWAVYRYDGTNNAWNEIEGAEVKRSLFRII